MSPHRPCGKGLTTADLSLGRIPCDIPGTWEHAGACEQDHFPPAYLSSQEGVMRQFLITSSVLNRCENFCLAAISVQRQTIKQLTFKLKLASQWVTGYTDTHVTSSYYLAPFVSVSSLGTRDMGSWHFCSSFFCFLVSYKLSGSNRNFLFL